jgi:hypothetical protein
MDEIITGFVGLDVHAESIAIGLAEGGRGAPRFVGTVGEKFPELAKALSRPGNGRSDAQGLARSGSAWAYPVRQEELRIDATERWRRTASGWCQPRIPKAVAYSSGTSSSATILMILISGLIAGPAVSLYGSPTVSPVTAALWASEPLPPK